MIKWYVGLGIGSASLIAIPAFLEDGISLGVAWAVLGTSVLLIWFFSKRVRILTDRAVRHDLNLCRTCSTPFDSENTCTKCMKAIDHAAANLQWRAAVLKYPPKSVRPKLRAFERCSRPIWYVIPLVLACMVAMVTMNIPSPNRAPQTSGVNFTSVISFGLLFPAASIAVVLTIMHIHTKAKKMLEHAKSHDFCICAVCTYPVDSSAIAGRCTECGSGYRTHKLRRSWYISWGKLNTQEALDYDIPLGLELPDPT
jgi:hypothetical protein